MKQILHYLTAFTTLLAGLCQGAEVYDVVVYGGTPGGITAAISAAREGSSVALLEQTRHVGGMSTSGLNRDELEHMDRKTMGGLSEKFLNEAARRSRVPPKPEGYITPGPRVWQSHIAEKVFLEMLDAAKVPVRFEQLLHGVSKEGGNITALTVRGGTIYKAKVFIDATYEGDLMAAAGVSYSLGREARDAYGESLGGVRYLDEKIKGSPYDEDGKLLPGIMPGPLPEEFSASPHPICYNIRLNLSKRSENSVPIGKPASYDPRQYELLARSLSSGWLKKPGQVLGFYGIPGGKMECNNCQYSIVSMSMPGAQTAWAEASFEEREAIHKKYREYTHGLLWFLKSDPRVPQNIREEMAGYGLCKDEWADNDHWPYYLYIRAARRMKGATIMTQKDLTEDCDKKDVIHIGSHFIDSHHVARYAVDKDHFINEGRIWEKGKNFHIPYKAITPRAEECRNLLVPVCVSSSAVAFCAIRLEPTWMHLGEVSGMAASLAIRNEMDVQNIDIKELQGKIIKAGIPLELPSGRQDAAGTSDEWRIDTTEAWQAAEIDGLWKGFKAQPATLKGFDVPLMTTPYPNPYDAPGGLKPDLGGYHAWQSKDMVHWVHHGSVTEKASRWVTTAEQVDGRTYIYYDFPNDQDPHLYIDEDLTTSNPSMPILDSVRISFQ
jgi:hypothetical protein